MATKPKYTFEQLSVLIATLAHNWSCTLDYHSSEGLFELFVLQSGESISSAFLQRIESELGVSVLVEARNNRVVVVIANY